MKLVSILFGNLTFVRSMMIYIPVNTYKDIFLSYDKKTAGIIRYPQLGLFSYNVRFLLIVQGSKPGQ
jgi:hypothetical protein